MVRGRGEDVRGRASCFSLAYVGCTVPAPFVVHGVEAALRYSDPPAVEARLRAIAGEFRADLCRIDKRATIRFNGKDQWGEGGRIVREAPVHAAFVRRKPHLDLE